MENSTKITSKTLYINNIPDDWNDELIKDKFNGMGFNVVSSRVFKAKCNYAFANFATEQEAQDCLIACDGMVYNQNKLYISLKVNKEKPKPDEIQSNTIVVKDWPLSPMVLEQLFS